MPKMIFQIHNQMAACAEAVFFTFIKKFKKCAAALLAQGSPE